MKKKSFPLAKVYTLLELGSIVLVSTAHKNAHTLHHRGRGVFAVGGELIKLPSRMK